MNQAEEKLNIVGLVVNSNPQLQQQVCQQLNDIAGVEVHASEQGKIVTTIDDDECDSTLVDTVSAINAVPGVFATSIAYHHFEGGLTNQEKAL